MRRSLIQPSIRVVLAFNFVILAGYSQISREQPPQAEIGFIDINADMKLRRMIVRNSRPKGVVLLLHGFPETLYAWKQISVTLARDYEVHAFDWPGYGLSTRPPADRFSYAPKDYAQVLKEYISTKKWASSLPIKPR